jgi:hypothetical protein
MAFSRIAGVERKLISSNTKRKEMIERGWFTSPFTPEQLEEVSVPFELEDETLSVCAVGARAYAPVWVYGIWVTVGRPVENLALRWDIVKVLLVQTRDDMREQELVSADLSLDNTVERSVRNAASNYIDVCIEKNKRGAPG